MAYATDTAAGFVGEFRDGVGYYCFPTTRFKTISIHALWINDLVPGEASLGALLPAVLKRGSQRWPSAMAMEAELENLYGASFRADVGKIGDKQLVSFHLQVVNGRFLPGHPDTLARGLEFLAEVLDEPRLTADGYLAPDVVDQEKELLRRQIEALINDKGQYAVNRLVEIMADGRRFGLRKLGRVEELAAVDAERLTAYYQRLRTSRPFVVFVVGDVDPERVKQFVRGRWNGGAGRESVAPIERFVPRHRGKEVVERQPVSQGKLNLGYATHIGAKDPDFPALMMYAGVLGGFPHSKLFVNVREKASLAYYAYARLDAAVGLMIIGAGIEFRDVEAATRIIGEQIEAVRAGRISPEEMAFTREAYRNDILTEEDNPHQLIGRQLEHIMLGGGLAGSALVDALAAVSVDDIRRVADGVEWDATYFLTTDQEEV